jgi:hypothetical protein
MSMSAPLPGPWVNHETGSDRPWASQDGIIKFIEFPVRRTGMSRRAFHLYWQRHHSPHVMSATGFSQFMRKYMTAHVYAEDFDGLPVHLQSVPRFEGVGEVWLNSLDDATAWLGHPLYADLIAPDESNFVDADGGGAVLVAREERLHDADRDLVESGLTKLYVTARCKPGVRREEFHQAISGAGRVVVARPSHRDALRRFVISHRLPEPYPDWLPPVDIDAVFELWFDDRATLRRFLADENLGSSFPLVAAGVVDEGSLRAIVTRLHVVHDEFSFQPTAREPMGFRWQE